MEKWLVSIKIYRDAKGTSNQKELFFTYESLPESLLFISNCIRKRMGKGLEIDEIINVLAQFLKKNKDFHVFGLVHKRHTHVEYAVIRKPALLNFPSTVP